MRNKAHLVEAGGVTAAVAGIVSSAVGAMQMNLTDGASEMSDEAFTLWRLSNQEVELRQAKADLSQARANIITILTK